MEGVKGKSNPRFLRAEGRLTRGDNRPQTSACTQLDERYMYGWRELTGSKFYCTPNLDLPPVWCRGLSTHLSQHHNPIYLMEKAFQVNRLSYDGFVGLWSHSEAFCSLSFVIRALALCSVNLEVFLMVALSLMLSTLTLVPQLWNSLPVPLKALEERRSYEVLHGTAWWSLRPTSQTRGSSYGHASLTSPCSDHATALSLFFLVGWPLRSFHGYLPYQSL